MMKYIGKVSYYPGWMGGDMFVGAVPIDDIPKLDLVADIKGKRYEARLDYRHGQDHDHGHVCNWKKLDLLVLIPCEVMGNREESVIRILSQTKIKTIKIFKKD